MRWKIETYFDNTETGYTYLVVDTEYEGDDESQRVGCETCSLEHAINMRDNLNDY